MADSLWETDGASQSAYWNVLRAESGWSQVVQEVAGKTPTVDPTLNEIR